MRVVGRDGGGSAQDLGEKAITGKARVGLHQSTPPQTGTAQGSSASWEIRLTVASLSSAALVDCPLFSFPPSTFPVSLTLVQFECV